MNRRLFLLTSLGAAVLPALSFLLMNNKPENPHKILVKMRLSFPEGKNHKDYLNDRKLWMDDGFVAHKAGYEKQGKLLSTKTEYFKTYFETEMIFYSEADMNSFHNIVSTHSLLKRKIRDELGYTSTVISQKIV